jgi:hypothetical protein
MLQPNGTNQEKKPTGSKRSPRLRDPEGLSLIRQLTTMCGATKQGFATSLQALLLLRTVLDAQLQMLTLKKTSGNENPSSRPADGNPHTG